MYRNAIRISTLAFIVLVTTSAAIGQKSKKKTANAPTGLAQFHKAVDAALADPAAQKAFIGALIVDAETKQPVYELNADRYFTPASNTKLFTTTLAVSLLGPDYHFRTTIETQGTIDPAGRLRGTWCSLGEATRISQTAGFRMTL